MITLKKLKKSRENSMIVKEKLEQQAYNLHFQLAIVNLEQNIIEERMPDLRMYA